MDVTGRKGKGTKKDGDGLAGRESFDYLKMARRSYELSLQCGKFSQRAKYGNESTRNTKGELSDGP